MFNSVMRLNDLTLLNTLFQVFMNHSNYLLDYGHRIYQIRLSYLDENNKSEDDRSYNLLRSLQDE